MIAAEAQDLGARSTRVVSEGVDARAASVRSNIPLWTSVRFRCEAVSVVVAQ